MDDIKIPVNLPNYILNDLKDLVCYTCKGLSAYMLVQSIEEKSLCTKCFKGLTPKEQETLENNTENSWYVFHRHIIDALNKYNN